MPNPPQIPCQGFCRKSIPRIRSFWLIRPQLTAKMTEIAHHFEGSGLFFPGLISASCMANGPNGKIQVIFALAFNQSRKETI
jgi:hypothetical protein